MLKAPFRIFFYKPPHLRTWNKRLMFLESNWTTRYGVPLGVHFLHGMWLPRALGAINIEIRKPAMSRGQSVRDR